MSFFKKMTLPLALLLVVTMVGCAPKASANAVAVVGKTEITKEQFEKNFKMLERSYNTMYGETFWTQEIQGKNVRQLIREEILENMIRQVVIVDEVKKSGFKPEDKAIEDAYAEYQATIKDDAETQKFFEEAGIDEAFIKNELTAQLYGEEFGRKIGEETEKDFEAKKDKFYQDYIVQVRASHILVDTEDEGKKILEDLKAGKTFEELAKASSKDSGTAENGGDLGYFTRGQMVSEFEKAAFSLPVGEVSELVKSQFGYHIIRVADRKTLPELEAGGTSAEELAQIKAATEENLVKEAYTTKLDALLEAAKPGIQRFEDRIK